MNVHGTPLLVVAGTGTAIGKTTIAQALVSAWAKRTAPRGGGIAGVKPIESGGTADGEELGQVSTFHVTRFTPPYLLTDAVSPHLAARRQGVVIDLAHVVTWTNALLTEADGVVLELAGGLFTPLTDRETNADLVRDLAPTRLLLVAPDRLGVLHDVIATIVAARALNVRVDGIVLSASDVQDAATGSNAGELERVIDVPVLGVVPRVERTELVTHADRLIDALGLTTEPT